MVNEMVRGAWLGLGLVACTSPSSSESSASSSPPTASEPSPTPHRSTRPIPDWPADARPPQHRGPPTEPFGEPGDEPQRWSAGGWWVAVCRRGPEGAEARLLVGPRIDVRIDWVGEADPTGRYLIARRDDHVVLVDAATEGVDDLGAPRELVPGGFDARGEHLAYGLRDPSGAAQTVIVRALDSKRERRIPSPIRSLRRVALDPAGRFAWLQGATPAEGELPSSTEGDSLCGPPARGASEGVMARVEEAALDLGPDEPVALTGKPSLRTLLHGFRSLGDAVVVDDGLIALRSSSGITTVGREGCGLEHVDEPRAFLLLACVEPNDQSRYWSWHDGALSPLDFWRLDKVAQLDPGSPIRIEDRRVVRGRNDTWLSMPVQRVVSPGPGYSQGHAFERHIVLVGKAGVEVRDATDDTVVAHHDLDVAITKLAGPFVLLSPREGDDVSSGVDPAVDPGGWVLDVREGTPPRPVEGSPLALSLSGHVAVRGGDGRLRWR